MLKRLLFLFLLIFVIKGCTKDDICPPNTATTPKLVITFNNFNNQDLRKDVEVLSVQTDSQNPILLLDREKTDSISIPLSTTSDTTKYEFIRTTVVNNEPVMNIDKLMFIYSRREIYINRACGFKEEYDGLVSVLELEEGTNWIRAIQTKRDTVKDDSKAHIIILH